MNSNSIFIVTPVFDDWESFICLLQELENVAKKSEIYRFRVLVVNDGSNETLPNNISEIVELKYIHSVEIIHLVCNLGHQRAIATGLSYLYANERCDAVIVMDADGEDQPKDVIGLLEQWSKQKNFVIVAQRTKRSESFSFKAFYQVYKLFFRAMTGSSISFGNYCLIPGSLLGKLVHIPEIWNNFAATIKRTRLPLILYPTERGSRFKGSSKMNLVALVIHGLSAVSVYTEVVFVRILFFSLILMAIGIFGITATIAIRLFTDLAIPGWATMSVGVFSVIVLQALMFSAGVVFLLLNKRTQPSVIPATFAKDYITSSQKLHPK